MARALPWAAARRNQAIAAELLDKRGRLRFLQRTMTVRDPQYRPAAGEPAAHLAQPGNRALAWALVAPMRRVFGHEAEGLERARLLLAAATEPSKLRAARLDTLAWALYANGYFEQAEERNTEARELALRSALLEDRSEEVNP